MLHRPEHGTLRLLGVCLVAVAVGVGVGRPRATPLKEPLIADSPTTISGSAADSITVHVSGAVLVAGLVEVPGTSRVADVLAAAGGVTQRADLGGVNLAERVSDGQRIVVPLLGATAVPGTSGDRTDRRVKVNDADVSELQQLPGVGPVLAQAIASYRDESGPFKTVEDLLGVPGIGEGKLATLRELVIVP